MIWLADSSPWAVFLVHFYPLPSSLLLEDQQAGFRWNKNQFGFDDDEDQSPPLYTLHSSRLTLCCMDHPELPDHDTRSLSRPWKNWQHYTPLWDVIAQQYFEVWDTMHLKNCRAIVAIASEGRIQDRPFGVRGIPLTNQKLCDTKNHNHETLGHSFQKLYKFLWWRKLWQGSRNAKNVKVRISTRSWCFVTRCI